MNKNFKIELTENESILFNQIKNNYQRLKDNELYKSNGDLVCHMWDLLLKRQAIPAQRIEWFVNPDYNIGSTNKSRQGIYAGNGSTGEKLLRDLNFFKKCFLYFIEGPDLPVGVLIAFDKKFIECGQITSSEITELATYARQLVRSLKLDRNHSAEEFFKLALEYELSPDDAGLIRNSVMKVT